jgi:hypothetical protein
MAYKTFVSSTFEDLKSHRQVVIASLRKAGIFVDPMEDWTAASDEPKKFSQDRLRDCNLCVLLVGLRRGHVPKGEDLSITQLEYKAAVTSGIDVLVFMLEEDAPWPRKFDELEKDSGIRQWRTQLKECKGVGFFGLDPSSIEIAPALTRWVAEKQQSLGSASSRRERVVLLKWLQRVPEQYENYFVELWRLGFGKDRPPSEETDSLEEARRELVGLYTTIVQKLPGMFAETKPSEIERGCFSEVFPAFKREATACFEASRTLINGRDAPCTDGSRIPISFHMLYEALEVSEHLRILRMAVGELIRQFPVDEVEESRSRSLHETTESLS